MVRTKRTGDHLALDTGGGADSRGLVDRLAGLVDIGYVNQRPIGKVRLPKTAMKPEVGIEWKMAFAQLFFFFFIFFFFCWVGLGVNVKPNTYLPKPTQNRYRFCVLEGECGFLLISHNPNVFVDVVFVFFAAPTTNPPPQFGHRHRHRRATPPHPSPQLLTGVRSRSANLLADRR